MSDGQTSLPLTSSAEDSPAPTSAWLGTVLDWLATNPDCGSSSVASLANSLPAGFLSRTSMHFYQAPKDGPVKTAQSSFMGWSNSGMAWRGGYLTLNTSAFPKEGVASSLSGVLESQPVQRRYFLSPRACRGILKRAENRGRALPMDLLSALSKVAARGDTA